MISKEEFLKNVRIIAASYDVETQRAESRAAADLYRQHDPEVARLIDEMTESGIRLVEYCKRRLG